MVFVGIEAVYRPSDSGPSYFQSGSQNHNEQGALPTKDKYKGNTATPSPALPGSMYKSMATSSRDIAAMYNKKPSPVIDYTSPAATNYSANLGNNYTH
ncbi:hypothetical protein COV16_01660 [Candidatus Woesearchaeota archaeon CG10_big_fil_rev_8_21_14_0_10_34_8]|nr:MAG: hypothetical protein COV16_01660 [Candidatus Woesearchaeota archaeon CG10_big_fil_rev_8_21_14_0_10_34_8]